MPAGEFYTLPPFRSSNSEFKKFLANPGLMAVWEEASTAPDQEVSDSSSSRSQRSRKMNQRLAHAVPAPCILGDSPDAVCKFAEWFYWIGQLKYFYHFRELDEDILSIEFPNGLAMEGLSYSVKEKKSKAFHFCPIAIFRASDQPFGYTSSVVICLYRSKAKRQSFREEINHAGPPVTLTCKPFDFIFLPTLQKDPLIKLSQKLAQYGIKVRKLSSLRKLLQEQIYLLFGIVPSFLFQEKNTRKLSTTIQLHPTVAYFWSLGLHTQGRELSHKQIHFSPEPAAGSFLTPEEEERLNQQALAEREICNSFVDTLYSQYLAVQDSLMGFLTHCCIQPGTILPDGIETQPATFLAMGSHSSDRCLSLRSVRSGDNLRFPPVPALLPPFFVDEHQQTLLEKDLILSSQKWMRYADRNNSCTFFTAALLYAVCGDYYPGALPAHSELSDAIPLLENQLLLTLEAPSPAQTASAPLLQSNSFWQVFSEKKGASLDRLCKRLSRAPRKLCIVLFETPRTLTDTDCFRLLSCSRPLLLCNVRLPENRPSVSISLCELGVPREDGLTDDIYSSEHGFPNPDDLLSLQMIADRLINFYTWVEANNHMLQIHWKASAACFKALAKKQSITEDPSQGSAFSETELCFKVSKRVSLAIKRSKNEPRNILHIPADATRIQLSERFCEQDLKPYLPYLSMILLLNQTSSVLDIVRSFPVPAWLSENPPYKNFSGYFSDLIRILPLRKEACEEIWSYLTNYFLKFSRIYRDSDGSPIICRSKGEYLACTNPNCLGWEEYGKLYLAYDRYWDAFIQTTPWPLALKNCRNRFQREILEPVLGKALVRESEKSPRWYCRPTTMKDGKQVRIGNFLVLRRKELPQYIY